MLSIVKSFTDLDSTQWTVAVNYGDGSATQSLTVRPDGTFLLHHFYDDNGGYDVTVQITDQQGESASDTLRVLVTNSAPTTFVTGPTVAVRGQKLKFDVSAIDLSLADRSAGFRYTIQWGDGSPAQVIQPTLGNGAGLELDHTFIHVGHYVLSVIAMDKDSQASTAFTRSVQVSAAGLQTDPMDASKTALFIGGTPDSEWIDLRAKNGNTRFEVRLNGSILGTYAPTGSVVIFGQAGHDVIDASNSKRTVIIDGGAGNDVVTGGSHNDVLIGGSGIDILYGGDGRDLLIGGDGVDGLFGGTGEDLEVAGSTVYDSNLEALKLVLAEWTSNRSYNARLANLHGTGSGTRANQNLFLTPSGSSRTVFDDGSIDLVSGGKDRDWFFANLSGGIWDGILDRDNDETVDEL